MRKAIFLGAILMPAAVLLAAGNYQPLNVKTGLWEVTRTTTATGAPPIPPDMQARLERMPPEQREKMEAMIKSRFGGTPTTTTYKKCLTAKDLNTNPFANGPDEKCTWTIVSSSGSDQEAKGTACELGKNAGMNTDVYVKAHAQDSENVKGTIQITGTAAGNNINIDGTFASKWVGADCGSTK